MFSKALFLSDNNKHKGYSCLWTNPQQSYSQNGLKNAYKIKPTLARTRAIQQNAHHIAMFKIACHFVVERSISSVREFHFFPTIKRPEYGFSNHTKFVVIYYFQIVDICTMYIWLNCMCISYWKGVQKIKLLEKLSSQF